MKYVFVSPSGESHVIDCPTKDVMRQARFWSSRWYESVDVFRCSPEKTCVYPVGPTEIKAAIKMHKPNWEEIVKTRCMCNSAIKKFKALPKRGSFSGIHLSGEIDRLQKRLDELGDKGDRYYPEVTIEVG
jgi:hypothetical protein